MWKGLAQHIYLDPVSVLKRKTKTGEFIFIVERSKGHNNERIKCKNEERPGLDPCAISELENTHRKLILLLFIT